MKMRVTTRCWLGVISGLSAIAISVNDRASAQIVPDASLGAEQSVVTPNTVIRGLPSDRIDGGAIRGSNLFHSFQQFNIGAGRGAYFANPAGIENILSRVTGNSRSDILGRLGVLGNANLFLLNPNGILFGANASLDVAGSFTATTANAIQFGDRGSFSATNPAVPSAVLTINPSAFWFEAIAAQPILNQSRATNSNVPSFIDGLRVADGRSLLLLGGNVIFDGGIAQARGGRVEIGGLMGSGRVGLTVNGSNLDLSFPDNATLANIDLMNGAILETSGIANSAILVGGEIQTHSTKLTLANNSTIRSDTFGNQDGGTISLQASQVEMRDRSTIFTNTSGSGNSGSIEIDADRLQMQNFSQIGTGTTFGAGSGGQIVIRANQSVDLLDNAQFASVTVGQGDLTGLGNAGDILVRTGNLNMQNASGVLSSTYIGDGNAGKIDIQAANINLINSNLFTSSIGIGAGGSVFVKTETLSLKQGSSIQTSTVDPNVFNFNFLPGMYPPEVVALVIALRGSIPPSRLGQASSGDLSIEATNFVEVTGTSVGGVNRSQLTTGTFGSGSGGELNITTGRLLITEGGLVNSSSSGSGGGGKLTVNATNSVDIDGISTNKQFRSALASESGSTGGAGDVTLTTPQLRIREGGFISTSAFGQGRGGNLDVTARVSADLVGTATLTDGSTVSSGLSTGTFSTGTAGTLRLETGRLTLREGGQILASTTNAGRAGDASITADSIELIGTSANRLRSSGIASQSDFGATGNAGNVTLAARTLSVRDGAKISTNTFGQGRGGNLDVTARESTDLVGIATLADGTLFSSGLSAATSGAGAAGTLRLETGRLTLREGGQISATTTAAGRAGDVAITADSIELVGVSTNRALASSIASSSESVVGAVAATGDAGNLTVSTRILNIRDGAFISTATFGQGQGGNLNVSARETTELVGIGTFADGRISSSGLFTSTVGTGTAGALQLSTKSLSIQNGAGISAIAAGAGTGGDINIVVDGTLRMNTGFIASASLFSEGGDINITARNMRLQGNSNIVTSVFSGVGGGGDINLTARSIIALDDSDILAFARDGKGGNVTLNTRAFFGQNYRPAPPGTDPLTLEDNDRVDINASGTVSGIIIVPDTTFIQNSLTQLAQNLIDPNTLLANSCIVRNRQQNGRFFITGSGGLPVRPGDAPPSPYPTGEVRSLPAGGDREQETGNRSSWKPGDPIVEPQSIYRLANGKLVMSRECEP